MICFPLRFRSTSRLIALLASLLLPFASARAAVDSAVVFSEIHYHPVAAGDAEWVELHCLSGVNVDLSGWTIKGGVNFTFPEGTVIPGRGYLVVAANLSATSLAGVPAIGTFNGQLANSGEEIRIENRNGRVMDSVTYADDGEWPVAADGSGVTLSKRDDSSANADPENWTWSADPGGSPGRANFATPGQLPATTAISALNSAWKYRDTNSAPPANWNSVGFDDSGWLSAGSAFYAGSATLAGGSSGLAGYWPITETSGTTTANTVAGGATGVLNGSVSFVTDAARGANARVLQLNGSGAYVDAGSATIPKLDLATDFTWAFWANSSQATGSSVVLGNRYSPTGAEWAPREFIKFTPSRLEYHHDGAGTDDIDYADFSTGVWVHHAVVKTGGTLTYYRNGTLTNSSSVSDGLDHAQPLYFGGDKTNESWTGKLDDIAIWNKALTTPQIAGLAAGTLTPLNASGAGTLQTQLQLGSTAFYFRRSFTFSGNPSRTSLALQLLLDDGAVVYINGQPIHSQNMPGGSPAHETLANSEVVNAALSSEVTIPGSFLVKGQNVIAVEVHQRLATADPDMVFALQLVATEQPPAQPDLTPGIVFNEITPGGVGFQVELANVSAAAIDLAGLILRSSTGASYIFPSQILNPGGFLALNSATMGFTPVSGDKLFLFRAGGNEVLDARSVSGKLRGRSPQGTWIFPVSATFGTANSFNFNTAIVINEIMYHARPVSQVPFTESTEQWVELYNRSAATIDVGSWRLDAGIDFTFPAGTSIPAGGYLVVANDAATLKTKWPAVASKIIGNFTKSLSGKGERIELKDALGNPVNAVTFADGGRWADAADGGGSSLELRDPRADNNSPEAWGASDESARGSWQTFTWEGVASNLNGDPTQWNEFIFGLLDAGTYLIDDISVIEAPAGVNRQAIQNGTFDNNATGWRFLGTQRNATVIADPSGTGNVLRVVASGPTEHMHNHAETTLKNGANFVTINGSLVYRISFRARWVSGANLLNARLYFNRLANTVVLPVANGGGTPGTQNSRAVSNIGPTYSSLSHSPAVPPAGHAATVSVVVSDPDNISNLTLFYSVGGASFLSTPMALQNGRYIGTVPAQAANARVQFYVQAIDASDGTSFIPAGGPGSRAMIPWEDNLARLSINGVAPTNIRIVMTAADATTLHTNTNVMSDDRMPCTVIVNESTIFYDCGVRLKGSERGRNQTSRVSFNIAFPGDQKLFGAHKTVAIDRSGAGNQTSQKEIMIKHAITHAGGIPGSEDDLCRVISPLVAHTGPAILVKQRFDSTYLDNQYASGADGRMFKYELIYSPTTTAGGGVENLKLPEPDGVVGVGINNLGAGKELYRWHWIIQNNEDADDYSSLITMVGAYGRPADAQFYTDMANLLDVDEWMRSWSIEMLFGIGDNYGGGNSQHNFITYRRPQDGKWLFFPHDMDFTFNNDPSGSVTDNNDLNKFLGRPAYARAYYGHLYEICNSTFNTGYLQPWAAHYSKFLNEDLTSFVSYINTRRTTALSAVNSAIPVTAFNIVTPNGASFPGAFATISGTGWVDIREFRLAGGTEPLTANWVARNGWQITLPIAPGPNTFTINAFDYLGGLIGTRTVTVNGTGSVVPAAAGNLVISELMYNPAPPSNAELAAGYSDADDFEFVEVQNISNSTIDLTNVSFSGISFTFAAGTQLPAGARIAVARNRPALLFRYNPDPLTATGQYGPTSQLSNDAEEIALLDAAKDDIVRFAYSDSGPWPTGADGTGYSIVLINPTANPDPTEPSNWRLSTTAGGNPGSTDATVFAGTVNGDDDQNGIGNFVQYGLAGATPYEAPQSFTLAGQTVFQYRFNLAADDARITVESSLDLTSWSPLPASYEVSDQLALGDGTALVTITGPPPTEPRRFFRVRVIPRL